MINIYIADDHPLIREGFKKIISKEIDMDIVGEATNAEELLKDLENKYVDILILDLKMPGKSGMELIKELRDFYPQLLILVVTMLSEEHYAVRSLKMGANGFISKSQAINELVKAIRSILSRGKYISSDVADLLLDEVENKNAMAPHKNLSEREFQIMCMIADGKKVKQIADELFLSVSTVNTYRSRIMRKIDIKTNYDLIKYVLENDLM
ncbi:MAG: response regulator transcription factor [Ignavibacteriaceae bacterium]|jgi:DNA-binding NarL/FixJ family response regulator